MRGFLPTQKIYPTRQVWGHCLGVGGRPTRNGGRMLTDNASMCFHGIVRWLGARCGYDAVDPVPNDVRKLPPRPDIAGEFRFIDWMTRLHPDAGRDWTLAQ